MREEDRPGHDPEGLGALACEVAERIADDLAQGEAGAQMLMARLKCPKGKLCCTSYRCSDFWCEGGFRCTNDFSHLPVRR